MGLIIWGIIVLLLVVVIVHTTNIKQSFVYLVLWLFSAVNLLFNSELLELFKSLFPADDFGSIGKTFGVLFFGFACVTVIHQGFIYYYLHDLESNTQKWNNLYPGFYNSKWDKSLRILAFLFLLMTVDKIPFVKAYIYSNCSVSKCSKEQCITLLGSSVLFMSLVIYDCIAGFWCKKWSESTHWIHTGGDMIAFLFWGVIAWKIIVKDEQTMGSLALVPLSVGLGYICFFIFRIGTSIYHNEVK